MLQIVDTFRHVDYVYQAEWKKQKYRILPFDDASLICDVEKGNNATLYPRVNCLLPRELRMEGLLL